jgi:hypothetical protein
MVVALPWGLAWALLLLPGLYKVYIPVVEL